MKKIIAIALVAVLALSLLTACGGNSNTPSGGNSNTLSGGGNTNQPANNNTPSGNSSGDLNGDLRSAMAKAFASGTLHYRMRSISREGEMVYELYMKDGMTASTMDMNGMVMRSIHRDGVLYSLYDNYKKYSMMELTETMNIFEDLFDEDDTVLFVGSGSMEFMGSTRKYEEFAEKDTDSRVFYFFDNSGILVGIRGIENGETQDIEILAFNQNVPNGVFDLPTDYSEANFDELMMIMSDMSYYGGDDDWDDDWDWEDD